MAHHFKVYAAVDFGTDGTGLAYCIPNTGAVYIHNKWKKWKKNRKKKSKNNANSLDDVSGIKPKTAILLNEDGDFVAFGDNALKIYLNMKDETAMLFQHFKMHLYNKPHYQKNNNINFDNDDIDQKQPKIVINKYLTASNGQKMLSSTIFTCALKHLKEQAMHVFRRNKLQIKKNSEVCWILTVPAIWDDIAKAKMREWAIAAGMIDPKLKNHLLLRYEPDCAALSIQQEIMGKAKNNVFGNNMANNFNNHIDDQKVEPKLLKNEVYILIDAGGGTTDIACHQIVNNESVKELLHPSGGPWGDMHIDIYFLDILGKIFQPEYIQQFKTEEPNCYLELLDNFRKSKWTFNDNNNSDSHNVTIPVQFIEFMEDKFVDDDDDIDDIEDLVDKFVLNGIKNGFELDADSFKIKKQIWKQFFFDKLIDPTVNHCKKLLSHNNMKDCKYLCIVGGFGAIKYFQKRMRVAFGITSKYKLDIIIPERPILSVLDGAARMAMRSNYISARRLARTYGISCSRSLDTQRNKVSRNFILNNKFWDDYGKIWMLNECFCIFTKKNDEIKSGQMINHSFGRVSPTSTHAKIEILCTQNVAPVINDNQCQQLAILRIPYDDNDMDKSIKVEFHFYDTTIKVYSYRDGQEYNKTEVELQYITK